MKIRLTLVVIAGTFVLGGCAGWVLGTRAENSFTGLSRQVREGKGIYTNPLLECDVAAGSVDAPKVRFERSLKQEIASIQEREGITDVAVYYRDLTNGPAFGVNTSREFLPASLLKVPLVMAFMKHAERDPSIYTKEVTFTSTTEVVLAEQLITPQKKLVAGTAYTVQELIERVIKYSDNDALELLYPLLPESEYAELYERLGIEGMDTSDVSTALTVVEYSTFFRVLFNASYLSQASSERALELLTQTVFDDGLRAGVPFPVQIAHKFGERDLEDGFFQLHDCGIVYVPKKPYLLCVMTRGTSQEILEMAIKDISTYTYKKVTE